MAKFYTCRNDRAFKEVFLNPNNSDLLKAILEFILKIKIDKLEINTYCIFTEEKQEAKETIGLIFKDYIENLKLKTK